MKKSLILVLTLYSLNIYSQVHIGAMGGYNLDNDKTQVGLGLNYMLFPKISVGAMAMITPIEDGSGDDYMIMYNAKYKLGKFTLVGGLMDMKMGNSPLMNMNINMNMNMDMNGTDPYFGIEYKLFKNKMLKVYYNHSDMMKSIGIMMPILNIGKKRMKHMDKNHNH
tara:strand:- start:1680 stop:2177 length:498 start_codon:yes stop_codon:yes gene_type:complete